MSLKNAVDHILLAGQAVESDDDYRAAVEADGGPPFPDPICDMILGSLVGRLLRLGATPEQIGRRVETTARMILDAVQGGQRS